MNEPRDWNAALERLRGAYADATLKEYRTDFGIFVAWCRVAGFEPLPASAAALAAFVADDFERCTYRTVKRKLVSIRRVHQLLRLSDETGDVEVTLELRRGLRDRNKRPKQALGLSAKLRDALIAACPPTLKGLRDRALIAVGYDTLCRRSELCALQVEDVFHLPNGTGKVLIRRAKNDQLGEGRFAYISAGGRIQLEAWLDAANLTQGPIFRPTYKVAVGKRAMHPRAVNRVLRDTAVLAGLEDEVAGRLSGHSMRVGAAQDLAAAGKSVLQIMRAGRWTHLESVERYVSKADVNVWAE